MDPIRDGGRTHLEQISDQISGVLDPVASRCLGWPAEKIRPVIARSWKGAFRSSLGEPGLTDTAEAISEGRPWSEGLWTDGW